MALTPFAFCGGASEGLHLGKQQATGEKRHGETKYFSGGDEETPPDGNY
jgi:hypothetical protein